MASLRDEARYVADVAKDAIHWIVIWKAGRAWHCDIVWSAEYQEASKRWNREEKWTIDAEDQDLLRHILAQDPNARLVNGYYMNIGPLEEMTLGTLIDGLRFQYSRGGNVEDVLAMIEEQDKEADA